MIWLPSIRTLYGRHEKMNPEVLIPGHQKPGMPFEAAVNGPFPLMRAAIPHMIGNDGGSVINIAFLGGVRCLSRRVACCTSKAALIMLTEQAARDYGPCNVRRNAVCPGFTFTAMTEGHFGNLRGSKETFRAVPLRGICSYLASDDSSYMTGTVLLTDGGVAIVDAFDAVLGYWQPTPAPKQLYFGHPKRPSPRAHTPSTRVSAKAGQAH